MMSKNAPLGTLKQIGRDSHRLLIGIAVAAPIVIASAIAAPPLTGLSSSARLVGDDELGEMRGKYIAPDAVNFFGIQMVSSWQTQDGNVLTASLEFEVNVKDGQFEDDAKLLAKWSDACSECDASLNIPNATPAGLNSVTGAVQTTEISGDDNATANIMRLRIGDYDADSAGFEGNGGAEITDEVRTVKLANGFAVQFEKGANSLGMILKGPGPAEGADGQASQGINGGAANQIAQHIQLVGDVNAVQNSLDIVIGLDQLQNTQVAVENALSAMKGWGF
jgi:hypothetical protein